MESYAQHIRTHTVDHYGVTIPDSELPLFLGLYARNESKFRFEHGHKATIRGIVDALLKTSILTSHNTVKKKGNDSKVVETVLGTLFGDKVICNKAKSKSPGHQDQPSKVLSILLSDRKYLQDELKSKLSNKLNSIVRKFAATDLGAITFEVTFKCGDTTQDLLNIQVFSGKFSVFARVATNATLAEKKTGLPIRWSYFVSH